MFIKRRSCYPGESSQKLDFVQPQIEDYSFSLDCNKKEKRTEKKSSSISWHQIPNRQTMTLFSKIMLKIYSTLANLLLEGCFRYNCARCLQDIKSWPTIQYAITPPMPQIKLSLLSKTKLVELIVFFQKLTTPIAVVSAVNKILFYSIPCKIYQIYQNKEF